MRGQRGQVAAEYMGVILVVSVIIAALASTDLGRELSVQAKAQICRIAETPCEQASKQSAERSERSRAAAPLARAAALRDPKGNDSDGDGVSDARERAQHTDPGNPDTDRDGFGDASDPAPRDTEENAFKPWERVGMTEKQWFELSKKILEEAWGNDSGNQLWWLMEGDWPVVANEARGEGWERYDGAVALLTGLVTGRLESEFLTIEDIGEGFLPHVNWD